MNVRDLIQSWDEAVQNASAKITQTEETNLENVAGLNVQSHLAAGQPETWNAGSYGIGSYGIFGITVGKYCYSPK